MDLLDELENIASTAVLGNAIEPSDIEKWQTIFGFSANQAKRELEEYRSDLSDRPVSREHWDLVKDTEVLSHFDIEAYSYSLKIGRTISKLKSKHPGLTNATYILKLEAPLESPEKIQGISGLVNLPVKFDGQDDYGSTSVSFCKITENTRSKLLNWLEIHYPMYNPTIIRLAKSPKDLSYISLAPFLGLETSLPHQRADSIVFEPLPRQDLYPVYYFFYGRLLEPDLLQRQLDLPISPLYRSARIRCAKMRSWQGKYKAVIHGEEDYVVDGGAFLVEDAEQEDSLRFFETDMYEVVRCQIEMLDGQQDVVPGLVFRFCGPEDQLEDL